MNSERWRAVEEIFHQALERPPSERAAWVNEACGEDAELRAEVSSLLESDPAAAGFVGSKVEKAVRQLHEDDFQATPRAMEGREVGPYRLIRELGRGGMGAVYLAARVDQQYESQVAIKLVRPGLDTDFILRRFRRERQILAHLQHPNIARLLDGGTTDDGIPYFVMEYVDGSWITIYCNRHKLSIDARLRLFLPVCAAVEYAHRNFIVHRDLKPGNILVDSSGVPKLLDFGVSKLLRAEHRDDAETQGVGMMTPDYASPEQILGEPVTVASDVYSLGAVLYELLTGIRPHRIEQCTPLALERAICLDDTVPPSIAIGTQNAIARRLTGDLDNIILKAMQKDPQRRYASVEQFADDLRRHLKFEPVLARPDTVTYRVGKFVRRHRLVVSIAMPATAALIAATAVAINEARIAQERSNEVRKLATTFVFDVENATRDLPGSLRARQLIARTGLEYLDKLARASTRDWTLQRELASAYIRMAELYAGAGTANLGDASSALVCYHRAGALLDSVLQHARSDRKAALDRMTVLVGLSDVQRQVGQTGPAAATIEDGLRRADALLSGSPNDLDLVQYAAVFHLDLARLRQSAGDLDASALESGRAIELLKQLAAGRPGDRETIANIGVSHARLGSVLAELGRRDEALASFRAGVAVCEQAYRAAPTDTHAAHELMLAYSHVGDTLGNPAYDNAGDLAGARAAYSKMAEIAKSLHDADPNDVRAISDYGIALLRVGIASPPERPQEKLAILQEADGLLTSAAVKSPKSVATGMHKAWVEVEIADLYHTLNDPTSALRYYEEAAASSDAVLAVNPKDSSAQRWLIVSLRGVAEEKARSHARAQAIATVSRILTIGEAVKADSSARSVTLRSIVPRTWQAAGAVYSLLASVDSETQRGEDLDNGRRAYERAVAEWQKLETQKGFRSDYRRESIAALNALERLAATLQKVENVK